MLEKHNDFSLYQEPFKSVTVAQSVMCLVPDPGVARLILAQSHTFAKIDNEIISIGILPPFANSRRIVVSCKRKYVHEVLVNRLVKLAGKKCG